MEPVSEGEAQSSLPSFFCGLAVGIDSGAKGVCGVWTGRACVAAPGLVDGREGVEGEGGEVGGGVWVLVEGRPLPGSPPRLWGLPST